LPTRQTHPLIIHPGICRYAVVDYAATKHAVLGLVRSLYKNPLFNFNLRINAVAPNYTDTGILPPAFTAAIGDLAQPADAVARSVALLMADVKRDGECVYSEKGRFWETENGEKGYHETLKRSMPEAKVEGILGILERFMVPNVKGGLKAKV
jgi:NAD(P)-dependent dehydrogenase (short-subunit alcohol dehydrogenase family)